MSTGKRRWAALVAPLVMISATVPRVLLSKVDWASAWPVWRQPILDTTLVVAAAALVAGVAAGVHAWRSGKDAPDA